MQTYTVTQLFYYSGNTVNMQRSGSEFLWALELMVTLDMELDCTQQINLVDVLYP